MAIFWRAKNCWDFEEGSWIKNQKYQGKIDFWKFKARSWDVQGGRAGLSVCSFIVRVYSHKCISVYSVLYRDLSWDKQGAGCARGSLPAAEVCLRGQAAHGLGDSSSWRWYQHIWITGLCIHVPVARQLWHDKNTGRAVLQASWMHAGILSLEDFFLWTWRYGSCLQGSFIFLSSVSVTGKNTLES